MKLNQYKIVFICLAFLCLNGCTLIDDFLEVDPSKSTRKTIQTAEQLDMVLARYAGFYQENPDIMLASDDYDIRTDINDAMSSGYSIYQPVYGLWNDKNNVDTRYHTWGKEYGKAYYANLVINNIDDVEGDESFKANLKAEAHFLRAYCYFQIALAHSLYYTGSNGDELGITLKQSTSFEESVARATLKETWDFIEADLQEGLKVTKSFKNSEGRNQNWRATTASVKAFAARYYLYRADYDKARKYAEEVLREYNVLKNYNDPAEMSRHSYVDMYTINQGTSEQEVVTVHYPYTYPQMSSDATRVLFAEWSEMLYMRACYYGSWWYIPSKDLLDTYRTDVPGEDPNNDLRYYYYVLPDFGLRYCEKTTRGRQPGYCQFFFDTVISGPTTAEMNLIIAECAARNGNIADAMKYVNNVRRNRIVSAVYVDLTASSQADALKKVLQERRREMAFTMRWYDLKRLNANDPANQVTVTRTFYPYNETTIQTGETPKSYVLAPNSRHYALPISEDEINKSKGVIQQNTY